MRIGILLMCASIAIGVADLAAQTKPTTAADYNGAFRYAVSETNAAFPFVYTVVVEEFANGEAIFSETTVNERQAADVERIIRNTVENGKTSSTQQISVGFGVVYCSNDGMTWVGPQQYECDGPRRIYGSRDVAHAEYTVEEKAVGGEKIKIYREYVIYKPSGPGTTRSYKETFATIDSRGFFISVLNNEGTLHPKVVSLKRTQTWDMKNKFKPIVAPK